MHNAVGRGISETRRQTRQKRILLSVLQFALIPSVHYLYMPHATSSTSHYGVACEGMTLHVVDYLQSLNLLSVTFHHPVETC